MNTTETLAPAKQHVCFAYLELCKPRVVGLMLITALVGMCLASPAMLPLTKVFYGIIGIGLAASSAAVINHLIDRRIDEVMFRTENRPIPTGQVKPFNALMFSFVLGIASMLILVMYINTLTAVLTFLTLIGYAIIYTIYLKHATPQNIVIGGIAGAMPPMLGWTCITGQIDPHSLLLVAIIFVWTPPHFWALAIHRYADYAKAKVPMLPVTHGIEFTKLHILLYTLLLIAVSILPFLTGLSGLIYLVGALVFGIGFLYWAILLKYKPTQTTAMKTFIFSIYYLLGIFVVMLIDHYIRITYV